MDSEIFRFPFGSVAGPPPVPRLEPGILGPQPLPKPLARLSPTTALLLPAPSPPAPPAAPQRDRPPPVPTAIITARILSQSRSL